MKIAILCSGQSGQHERMLDDFLVAADCAGLRSIASEVLGRDVAAWWRSLDETQLFSNANAQFAIALYQIATWQRIANIIPQPAVVAGYSVGEVMAWHVAGSLDPRSTLRLIRARAFLMDKVAPNEAAGRCMLLWRGRSAPAARDALRLAMKVHGVSVAIYRPDGELVLGGPAQAVAALLHDPAARACSLRCIPVFVPAHTPWLSDAVMAFHDLVVSERLSDPSVPVLSGVDGTVLRVASQAATALSTQIAHPLRWDWCQNAIEELGPDTALELGPGTDLAKMFEASNGNLTARAVGEFGSSAALLKWLQQRGH